MSLNKPIKPILNNQVSCAIVTCMDTRLNKNAGQILKLMHEALALGQKSGNDALKKATVPLERQTQRAEQAQRIEQTDLRPVAVHLSAEAKETLRNRKREKTKKRNNKKQQKQSNENEPNY